MVDRRTVEIPEEQIEARTKLGAAIRNWFRLNRWSQDVPNDWAKIEGFNGPWNSQMSLLFNGRLDPKAQFWLSLAEFNKVAAMTALPEDYKADMTRNELVYERIRDGEPFLNVDGRIADAIDFYGMFVGMRQWHPKFDSEPLLSEKEAKSIGERMFKQVETLMLDRLLTRAEVWELLKKELNDDPDPVKRWLIGLDQYTPELHQIYGDHVKNVLNTAA